MVCTRKVWGVLGLLLALVVVVGYGQYGQQPQPPQPPQPLPIPEPSLDVYAYWWPPKEIVIYVTLLLQGQPLTAVAESITVELQDRSAKTLATQQFAKISLAGTTQLIMAIPVPPPPEPWILKVTAVVGGKIYSGETTVLTESGIAPSELMAAPPTPTPSGWVRVGPPFAHCGTGHNWASSGSQQVNCNAGRARIFENGLLRGVTGEGWAWFASNPYSSRATQIRVVGSITGEIEKPRGQPESSATLYAFIIGYNNSGGETGRIGGVVWRQDWDGTFNSTFNRTFSGTLPSGTTYVKAYVEVRARVRDEWRPGGANGWVWVDQLSLTDVQIYF
jgi:hypothetical protein